MCPHLLKSYLIILNQHFVVFTNRSCTYFLKFMSKYFIFFDVIVLLILVSARSLLVYGNVNNLCILIYSVTFWTHLFVLEFFFVNSLGFSIKIVRFLQKINKMILLCSFLPFTYFSCFLVWLEITLLN